MKYIDLISANHKSTKRDYLARVNDKEFPKYLAASLAKKWDYDYWDGSRKINYGGYYYKEGYWDKVAKKLISYYDLKPGDKVLDIGCGKGFLLYDLKKNMPDLNVYGLDISEYAIKNSKVEIRNYLRVGKADYLPFNDLEFDLAYSINTFHNLHNFELNKALREIQRIAKKKYICMESYRNEVEKQNLLYWQVTCEMFCTPSEWEWWFNLTKYDGDYSFIYFE